MDKEQYKQWFADHCTAFPHTAVFVNSSPNKAATHELWLEILGPHQISDALEATRRMLSGREEPVKDFDRAMTPQRIAEICSRIAAGRRKAPSPVDRANRDRQARQREPREQWSMLRVARILEHAKLEGRAMTVDEAIQLANDQAI